MKKIGSLYQKFTKNFLKYEIKNEIRDYFT